jgi:glycine/D-amino acid oxidase-like deaminating enzyme
VSRWDVAGVRHPLCARTDAAELFSDADLAKVSVVFDVADISINTRLLYRRLQASALRYGAEVRIGTTVAEFDGNAATLRTSQDDRIRIQAGIFVHTAGFGAREIFRSFFGVELPIRYWKSHLVVTPRLGAAGLFYIDAHEAAMMHHGDHRSTLRLVGRPAP